MVGEILCPDCGGVVGATETTEDGDPCRCFVGKPADDTQVDAPTPEPVAPADRPKICRVCGKDVSGQKRAKDHTGYYCYDCHKAEEKRENYGRVRCQVCGHLVKEESLADYEGTRMCPTCLGERTELKKQQIQRLGFVGARNRNELRQIYVLLIILAVLAVIICVGTYLHGRR
jgi:DNA-directed RNA polymerase subunit RPC12/RpoP